MTRIIHLLELIGRESAGSAAGTESALARLPEEMQRLVRAAGPVSLAAAIGARAQLACYITAPDSEPMPADAPDDLPEDPEQHESEAA